MKSRFEVMLVLEVSSLLAMLCKEVDDGRLDCTDCDALDEVCVLAAIHIIEKVRGW